MASFFDLKARKAAAANGSAPKADDKKQNTRRQPWVEKYRPKTLSDVTAQDHTVNVLQRTLQASNVTPTMTSTHALLRPSRYRQNIDDPCTGQGALRARNDKVTRARAQRLGRAWHLHSPREGQGLCTNAAHEPARRLQESLPVPPFKIIILDEADSMTQDAQSALRRTMETYSKITRFCLICNYVTRIIDPLASRCSKFRFKSLDQGNAKKRLEEIAEKEGVGLDDGAVDALIKCSEGDLRKAITYLQSAARLVGAIEKDQDGGDSADDAMDVDRKTVSVAIVQEIAGVIPEDTIAALQKAMQPRSARATYQAVAKVVEDMVADGWSAGQVVTQLYHSVLQDETIPDLQKNKITLVFSEVDKRLLDGADEHLSILDLALRISNILSGKG
ncbi:replication factor C [Apiospora aurea]|uniref:Replication factor C n=1 Tax=Apiospora aurea TaxID=335848 RepID=A0ABR1QCZ2_9PEZI